MEGVIAYIGIGSNLDDPPAQCRKAIALMSDVPGISVMRASSFYRTQPVGLAEQDDFVNAVCEVRTTLSPRQLLAEMKSIESRMGRREGKRWGPRRIDLDLLLYGQEVIEYDDLVVPHPECHKRRFVLAPLGEIASYVIHPAFGISVQGLLERLEDNHAVEALFAEKSLI